MSRVSRWLASPEARWIIAIFALAFFVRLVTLAYVHPSPRDGRYDDSVFYDSAARNLAAGHGYVFDPKVFVTADGHPIYPDETALTATALWPPGYPATLAAIYKVTGNSQWAARLLNVLLGALTPVLVFLIARKLFDLTAAVFAGFTLALLPGHVLFTALLMSETEFGFLIALVLALCVYFVFPRDRPSLLLVAGVGVLTAFTGYVRGEFLAFGLVLAALILFRYRRQAALPLAALALGAAVIVTPWVVRNEVQMHALIVGTTGTGRVAYQGHNPFTKGHDDLLRFFDLERPYKGLNRTVIEVKANNDGLRLARTWAWDHKLHELQLFPTRLWQLFDSDDAGVVWIQSDKPWFGKAGADKLTRLSNFTFFGLMALVLAGLPLWFRGRDLKMWCVFALVPLYLLLFGVIFIGTPRYHYALYIPFSVFGSVAMAEIWRMTADRWRQVFGGRSVAVTPRDEAAVGSVRRSARPGVAVPHR